MEQFIKERNFALTKAVMEDDFEPVLIYFEKYNIVPTNNPIVVEGAVYKSAYNCLSLPQNVRERAKQKCIEFNYCPHCGAKMDEGEDMRKNNK